MKNGVTLLSLVIILVVLTILAVATISVTVGNNGVFNKSKEIKELYQNEEKTEEEKILEIEARKAGGSAVKLKNGTNVIITEKNISDYIGEEVDYNPTAGGTWRIFYLDVDNKYGEGKGTVFIKRDYDDTLTFSDSSQANYATDETIKYYFGKYNPLWLEKDGNIDNRNERVSAYLCNPENWKENYLDASKGKTVIGSPSVELYMDAYNQWGGYGEGKGPLSYKFDDNAYGYSVGVNGVYYHGGQPTDKEKMETGMFNVFMDKDNDDTAWLASPNEKASYAILFVSGYWEAIRYNDNNTREICPVASLKGGTDTKISDVGTVAKAKQKNAIAVNENVTLKDDNNKEVKIPAGFKIAEDSATDRADGIVIEDKDGNQFVWIPVDNIYNYKRTAFKGEIITQPQSGYYYSETIDTDEQTSVNNYGGYYIGRYDAGDSTFSTKSGGTLRTSSTSISNPLVIKKGYAPYNYISRIEAIARAEAMDTEQGYSATTKLCSSYAWDTAISFIQNKVSNYGSSSPQGNYRNVDKNYIDITGTSRTVASGTNAGIIPTGQTISVCNIYDMGGNLWKWTKENITYNNNPCVRGGSSSGYSDSSAGCRSWATDTIREDIGFRVTLFL